jgi:excisionase family DNA binding protein
MYLSAAEACERLRLSRDTLHKLIRTGALAAHKTSSGKTAPYRISEEAIAEYLRRHTAEATS